MDATPQQATRPPTVLGETCSELGSLAKTLTGLLERARRRGPLGTADQQALDELKPRLEELLAVSQPPRIPKTSAPRTTVADPVDELADHEPRVAEGTIMAATSRSGLGRAIAHELASMAGVHSKDRTGTGLAGLSPIPASRRDPHPDQLLQSLISDLGANHSIQGTASSLPVVGVFQFLSRTRKTGCLAVRLPERTLRFVLVDGGIVFSASDPVHQSERLGGILIELGVLRLHQLADYLNDHSRSKSRPLGLALEEAGIISTPDLARALSIQARRRASAAMEADHAAFAFYPGTGTAIDEFRADVLELMLESARERDERGR